MKRYKQPITNKWKKSRGRPRKFRAWGDVTALLIACTIIFAVSFYANQATLKSKEVDRLQNRISQLEHQLQEESSQSAQVSSSSAEERTAKEQQINQLKQELEQVKKKTTLNTRLISPIAKSEVEEKVRQATIATFGEEHWAAMRNLLMRESGFNPLSLNKQSGACGIFQALPCTKMGCSNWQDIDCQIRFGLNYIKQRYGTPTEAYNHWLARKPINGKDHGHWY